MEDEVHSWWWSWTLARLARICVTVFSQPNQKWVKMILISVWRTPPVIFHRANHSCHRQSTWSAKTKIKKNIAEWISGLRMNSKFYIFNGYSLRIMLSQQWFLRLLRRDVRCCCEWDIFAHFINQFGVKMNVNSATGRLRISFYQWKDVWYCRRFV